MKKLNLLLVFQVNCPGCFVYALPLMNQLVKDPKFNDFSFLAISTAFEDFDKNTRENTELLCAEGLLIGETKEALEKYGYERLPYKLEFPVAMDYEAITDAEKRELTEIVCQLNPNYDTWADWEQKMLLDKVQNYLNQLEQIRYSFTANQMKGTPTFVVFDQEYRIRYEWFGHKSYDQVTKDLFDRNLID